MDFAPVTTASSLAAQELRLSHERERLRKAKPESERALRKVWVSQIEKEISDIRRLLGMDDSPAPEMTDDELLAALSA